MSKQINYEISFTNLTADQAKQITNLVDDFKNDNGLQSVGMQGIEPGKNGITHILSYGNRGNLMVRCPCGPAGKPCEIKFVKASHTLGEYSELYLMVDELQNKLKSFPEFTIQSDSGRLYLQLKQAN